ncbi:unnamed protein product [Adineta ricciae]|uniref:IF rod domain-containing protein n=1 Tax=Adineta ricciae TaxID=249248 RepID=A0A814MAI9_ADIRI|nr:unnamed protein product [Adineta ricciae]CAF1076607.1 unnamed protein product [Adineta ricciae]
MTESVITISPKTSPYHSPVSTRHVSPSASSATGSYMLATRHRNLDQQTISNEKLQLRKLNDQFLSYIERVRLFETYNNCLTSHCEQIKAAQERTKTKLDLLKQEFDEYQQEKFARERKDIQLENENIKDMEKQVHDVKTKEKFLQHEHDLNRQQIIDLQQQFIALQSKTEKLRFDYENVNDDSNHYRRQISYYQLLKSSILDEISHQRDINQRVQLEVDDLKIQKQIAIQSHEADAQAIEIHNDNMVYDLTTNFRFDGTGKHPLTQTLNEIREEYKTRDNDMREELHRKYLLEYNQHIKRQADQNLLDTNREDIERRHLSNELNSLNDHRTLLQQKLTLIHEHYKQLELNFERELNRQKSMQEKYEQQINDLRGSVKEYQTLLNTSTLVRQPTIEAEVNKYRQLLEGSDQQLGLRQLIHMPNKIEHSPSINRPTTPSYPLSPLVQRSPSPINKLESVSALLLIPSHTRQNSNSEASYETAPISQSSTPTTNNQQYLTFESVNDKLSHTDYDTDNDQSQTIQYMSGRSSRLTSTTDSTPLAMTPTNQESLPPLPFTDLTNQNETIVEISFDTSQAEGVINQTLPFVPMNVILKTDMDERKDIISDEQQSPLISTLEKREESELAVVVEPTIITSSQIIIPITVDVDSKPIEESNDTKIISPVTPTISIDEQSKSSTSPNNASDSTRTESTTAVEIPLSALPAKNPLAKLMPAMLPNAAPFVPSSNGTHNQPVSPVFIPISTMNNDALPFVPIQQQPATSQQQWNGANTRSGSGSNAGGNRRGQLGGGNFHHGGGNQRSGGGGNWHQGGGGGHQKQRRGMK